MTRGWRGWRQALFHEVFLAANSDWKSKEKQIYSPPELSQTPGRMKPQLPGVGLGTRRSGGRALGLSCPAFQAVASQLDSESSANGPEDLLCWEVRWLKMGWGRASWPLGNWKGSNYAGEGIPAGERKSYAKINLEKLRQRLFSWPQIARTRSRFLFSASSTVT